MRRRRSKLQIPQMRQIHDGRLIFRGGLSQQAPTWDLPWGKYTFLRASQNYEQSIQGGYSDIEGYERFDGRTSPSAAGYATMDVVISGSIEAGDTITGGTSGATAVVVAVVTTTTPSYLVITKISGTFTDGEDLEVSAVVEGTVDDVAVTDGASTTQLHAQYLNLAADEYRGDIGAVPGEGSVLGVWMLNDVVYAFRNATGGATAKMYKATASGWSEVDLGEELAFTSGGTTEISEGDTITGATSSATATVERVILTGGTWAGGDAAGRLILSGVTGTFQAENLDVGASTNLATIAGDSTAITLLPDGAFEFYNSNFNSAASAERMYGCDGVNRGFEFDGSVFVPIDTGMTSDQPTHVIVHKQHLFFSFQASLQHSGIGDPYSWTLLTGASELRCDDTITGLQREPGSAGDAALSVFQRNRLAILYGTSSSDWNLVPYRDEVGAYAGTIQNVGFTMFLDDRGLTSLRAVQEYGNFNHATLSADIQTYINAKRSLAVSSCIVRDKNQYRLFFSDGAALYVTMDGRKVGAFMPCLLDNAPTCICSLENSSGAEKIYFGASNGYVYQLDAGTSFDGGTIEAYMTTHYSNDGIRHEKTYRTPITLQAEGQGYASVELTYELSYGQAESVDQPVGEDKEIAFSNPAEWDDDSVYWDSFFWDGQALGPTSGINFRGTAENVSFTLRKDSDYMLPVRHTGLMYHYSIGRRKR